MEESRNRDTKLIPFVKWAGGKRQLLGELKCLWPKDFRKYIEPFVGGGIVYLTLRPNRAVLGDTNSDLINCYSVVRDNVDDLIEVLERYVPHVLDKEFYCKTRDLDPSKLAPVEQAARFIFLNKTCYNGLYRVNRDGSFNVPFGKHERPPRLHNEANLRGISQVLQNAELVAGDFEDTVEYARDGDFLYLDPPYHRSANSQFTSYSVDGFSEHDHIRLAKAYRALHGKGCRLLLSNSDTDLVRSLYSDFLTISVMTNRSINCVGGQRRNFPELLIMNYAPESLEF